MLWKKKAAAAVAVASVALGLSLATATPAAAATGTWVRYGNTNPITSSSSTWRCDGSESVGTNLVAQVCAIRSPSGASVQGAVIVRNNGRYSQYVPARVALNSSYAANWGNWDCGTGTVLLNSWSVCFGSTIEVAESVFAWGYANSYSLEGSPRV
ncbi:hypothetical protein [Nocardiopsis sp. NRRL B-16309]|uniref:hypothetical protein n=1 Tax=Nocardiopsis sp. NRRL B-16309 TaxID=1519494 RepID=UPI000A59468A|nr:hypothetical protein [Nocardiopsis sp. NRRL B-16309]